MGVGQVALSYGRGTLAVTLDPAWRVRVIEKRPMPVIAQPAEAVAAALAGSVAAPPLAALARTARRACILVCDITRPVPNGLFLGPLVRTLRDAGMAADAITILVATGLHRPNLGAELGQLIGDDWVMEQVTVVNHDARDASAHVDLGRTATRATPVVIDRRFAEADLRIATGLVEPHFMAGYSGGRKVIAPGVAGEATIRTFHNAAFMAHPRAANCVLDGNPLHEEQVEILRMLGGALALNTVIDDARRLAFVNFGEIVESHLAAVAFTRRYAVIPVAERFPTVVTSAAGHPLDRTYYQTVKGMVAPLDIIAPGGDLIIASACDEGLGSPHYRAAQENLIRLGAEGFAASIRDKPLAAIDEWQTQMQLKSMRHCAVHLVSDGLDEDARALTGVAQASSVEAAVRASVARHGDGRVAFIPEGPYVVPRYTPPRGGQPHRVAAS